MEMTAAMMSIKKVVIMTKVMITDDNDDCDYVMMTIMNMTMRMKTMTIMMTTMTKMTD